MRNHGRTKENKWIRLFIWYEQRCGFEEDPEYVGVNGYWECIYGTSYWRDRKSKLNRGFRLESI